MASGGQLLQVPKYYSDLKNPVRSSGRQSNVPFSVLNLNVLTIWSLSEFVFFTFEIL